MLNVRDVDFRGVIQGCATAQNRIGEVWITPQVIEAYFHLHQLGIARLREAMRLSPSFGQITEP